MTAEVLGNFQDKKLIPHLIPLLGRENKYLVIAVLESLAKLNAREAISEIIKLLEHPSPEVRRTAAKVLGEIQT